MLNTAVNSCWLSQGDMTNTIHLPKKVFKIQNSNRDSYFLTKTINWIITRKKLPVHSTEHIVQIHYDAYTTWKCANYFSCFCADIRFTFLWAQFEHCTARFTWALWGVTSYCIVWFIWLWNSKSPINQDFNSINVYRKWKNQKFSVLEWTFKQLKY